MINWLTNSQPSMLPQMWQFNTNQDWGVLGDEFDSVSLETIPNATLQALGFYYSPLGYLKKGTPRFADITDKPELKIKLENDNQPITKSMNEKARKRLDRAAKRNIRQNNLCASIRQALIAGSVAPFLSRSPMLTLSRPPLSALSCPPVSTLLSLPVPALLSPLVRALSSFLMPALLSPLVLALLSHSVLSSAPTYLHL